MSRLLLALVLLAPAGCLVDKPTTAAAKKVLTRDEFKRLVIGKTADEVIAAVGRPDATDDAPDGTPLSFHFMWRVMNPATGEAGSGFVEFKDGVATAVRW